MGKEEAEKESLAALLINHAFTLSAIDFVSNTWAVDELLAQPKKSGRPSRRPDFFALNNTLMTL